jgi:hypothetical protein
MAAIISSLLIAEPFPFKVPYPLPAVEACWRGKPTLLCESVRFDEHGDANHDLRIRDDHAWRLARYAEQAGELGTTLRKGPFVETED